MVQSSSLGLLNWLAALRQIFEIVCKDAGISAVVVGFGVGSIFFSPMD